MYHKHAHRRSCRLLPSPTPENYENPVLYTLGNHSARMVTLPCGAGTQEKVGTQPVPKPALWMGAELPSSTPPNSSSFSKLSLFLQQMGSGVGVSHRVTIEDPGPVDSYPPGKRPSLVVPSGCAMSAILPLFPFFLAFCLPLSEGLVFALPTWGSELPELLLLASL